MTKHEVITRNNVNILSKGKQPIIFAHGLGLDQTSWVHIQPAFQRDYKVVLFDHVGCGNADKSAYSLEKYSTLSGYASDLVEICDVLELDNAIFVGHSVSAMIGVIASLHRRTCFSKMI